MAEDIAVAVSGKWSYDSNDKDMKAIYDALMKEADVTDFTKNTGSLNQRRIGLYFSDLKISIGPDDDSQNLFPILAFETNSLKTPLTFATGGKITISDTTAPTVKNVYIQSRDTDFRPGDVIPILVEFSEPVQGNYILFVVHENADTFLASAYAEHTRKLHLIRKPVLLDKLFELLDNNVRALDMAGRADTYLDLHANSFL